MNLAVRVSILLIRGYQKCVSPLLGARCRFYPSCSQYAVLAMTEWGFLKGAWLTAKRLARCGPWREGGFDPPPHRTVVPQRRFDVKNNERIKSESIHTL